MNTHSDAYWRDVIDPGDRASKLAKEICFKSHRNNDRVRIVAHQPGNFRGPIGFTWNPTILDSLAKYTTNEEGEIGDWEILIEVENDGAGGKPQFFTLLGEEEAFRGLGWEIIAMTADDFARSGRLPVIIDNEVNVKRITAENFHLFQAMMEGYGDALAKARLINITGETAVMKHCITAFCDANSDNQLILTWGASCIGLCEKSKLIDGSQIKPGMPIIGLHEKGYRCNGGTFFTNLICHNWGGNVQSLLKSPSVKEFARKLTVPSISYAKFITELVGWDYVDWKGEVAPTLCGIVHVTGGGVWGKFKDILPKNVGADLHRMPTPPQVLLDAQKFSMGTPYELSDHQAYGTLHGGCGMLIICKGDSESAILRHAERRGIGASVVGLTTSSFVNEIEITSRFADEGRVLSSERPE